MIDFKHPTWGSINPRSWQVECYGEIQKHFLSADPEPVVASAIMGAGKSILLSELCANVDLEDDQVIVVSTSTRLLVESLYADIKNRCSQEDEIKNIGRYYSVKKRLGKIIVTCTPSIKSLSERLRARGLKVFLWIADECHRTECSTVLESQELLNPMHSFGLSATVFRSDESQSLSIFKRCIFRYGVAEASRDGVIVPWKIENSRDGMLDLDEACFEMILDADGPGLTNASSIADAEEFADYLSEKGIAAEAIHSKQNAKKQNQIISDLKEGKLKTIVHVSLLQEGANYPWLKWLVLRRDVGARVRFIQEVGRLLRSYPGKDVAVMYDPHDLFGTHALTYEEALGEPPEKETKEMPDMLQPETIAQRFTEMDPPLAMTYIETMARSLVTAGESVGIVGKRKQIKKEKRGIPATKIQQVRLKQLIGFCLKIVPQDWLECIGKILSNPELLRYGFASDMIALLEGVRESKVWPPVTGEGHIKAIVGGYEIPTKSDDKGQLEVNFLAMENVG